MENYMFQDMSKDFDIKKIRRSNTISESNCEPHVHPFHEIFIFPVESAPALLITISISLEKVIL